jgi:hypothetical protein
MTKTRKIAATIWVWGFPLLVLGATVHVVFRVALLTWLLVGGTTVLLTMIWES